MGIEYLGLSSINGPLVILEGVQDAFFDEIVEFTVDGKTKKIGRIIELYEDKAVIQVFEGTENMSLDNTRTKLTGHPMEVSLAPDMLGRTFNGSPLTSRFTSVINGPNPSIGFPIPLNVLPSISGARETSIGCPVSFVLVLSRDIFSVPSNT